MQILELMLILLLIMKIWFKLDIDWEFIIIPSIIVAILEAVSQTIIRSKAIAVKAKIEENEKGEE